MFFQVLLFSGRQALLIIFHGHIFITCRRGWLSRYMYTYIYIYIELEKSLANFTSGKQVWPNRLSQNIII
jgi:hypothetical protein